jgi:hypothetical protein
MEISPIAGIRAMPVMKVPPKDPELTAVFDIDNSAEIGDETWTPSDSRSGRGSEDDGSDDEFEDFDDPAEVEGIAVSRADGEEGRQVSFFA